MADRIPIHTQILEVERELGRRGADYPALVARGRMRRGEADLAMQRLRAVKATLEFCRDNEADIREFVAANRAAKQEVTHD